MKQLTAAVLGTALLLSPFAAHAAGFGGSRVGCCGHGAAYARALAENFSRVRGPGFKIDHKDRAVAIARIRNGRGFARGTGTGKTRLVTWNNGGAKYWARTFQRSGAIATNKSASANALSASFIKYRGKDGTIYVYKGYVTARAYADPYASWADADGIFRTKLISAGRLTHSSGSSSSSSSGGSGPRTKRLK